MAEKQEVTDNGTMADTEHDFDPLKHAPPSACCKYEDVIGMLGTFGKFQFIQLTLCSIGFLPGAVMGLGFVFIGYTPPHVCNAVNETDVLSRYGLLNDSTALVSYGSCQVTVSTNQSGVSRNLDSFSCPDGRIFTGGRHLTLTTQWDLVCESMGMAEVGQALFIGGQIIGGFFVTPCADRFGRKLVMCVTAIICALIEFSITFSPNIYTVWALLFIDGLIFIGFNSNVYVLGIEYLQPKQRENFGVAIHMVWVACILYVDLLGYIFQDIGWRYFQAVGAITVAVLFVYPCFLCESPRWLASKNRPDEALVILKKACRQNGIDFAPVKNKFMEYLQTIHPKSQSLLCHNGSNEEIGNGMIDVKIVHYTMIDILRHKYALVVMLASWYIWITHNVTYYGIYMTSSSLSGDRFINFAILALVEIPSNLAILYMFKRLNRLIVLRMFLLPSILTLLASSVVSYFSGGSAAVALISTVLVITGKFAITASFNALYISSPEMFPTVLRASAFGACKSVARVGSLLAPYFRPLYDMWPWAPGIIFSAMCIIALFLVSFLPETKDKSLPTTIEEMKQLMKERKTQAKHMDSNNEETTTIT